MTKNEYASHVKRLRDDETLTMVLRGIQEDAATIFMNPNSDEERILEAHRAIQAVGTLVSAFDAIEADALIENDRES